MDVRNLVEAESDFSYPSRPAVGATLSPVQLATFLTGGVKRTGRGVDHPTPYIAEINQNYSYSSTSPVARRGMLQGELYLLPFIT